MRGAFLLHEKKNYPGKLNTEQEKTRDQGKDRSKRGLYGLYIGHNALRQYRALPVMRVFSLYSPIYTALPVMRALARFYHRHKRRPPTAVRYGDKVIAGDITETCDWYSHNREFR